MNKKLLLKAGMENITIGENEWLKFILKEVKPKTKIYSVWSKCSNIELGEIKWYPQWRHYCFFIGDKVYSDRCLIDMGEFILHLNEEHKGGKQNAKRRSKNNE